MAEALVLHFGQRRIHHEDETNGDRDVGRAGLVALQQGRNGGHEAAQRHAEGHGEKDPEGEVEIEKGKARDHATPELARLFAALADTTRLRLLNLIAGREVCVCYLVEVLRQSQPKISRHLAYLRRAGLVQARREGKWMHYRLYEPLSAEADAILAEALAALRREEPMQADTAKLERACCVPLKLVLPVGAPRPASVAGIAPKRSGEGMR